MKVGVCGTGRMGSSIAQRLMAVGHDVAVWNRDLAKTKSLTDAGAKLLASPAELAEDCEAIIVMLLNDDATEAVYRGPKGILKAKLVGKLLIDMSTVRPDTMKSIGTAVTQQGAVFVESPVGGSTGPAREGKLFGLVGGTRDDVSRALPILEQLCRRIEHVGGLGSGATMKLAINLPLLVYWQALGEALTICAPLKLTPDRLIDILSDPAGTPTARLLGGISDCAGTKAEPAMRRAQAPPSLVSGNASSPKLAKAGAISSSSAGSATQACMPCTKAPEERSDGSVRSECTMPDPAVIQLTSPGRITWLMPRLSR